MKNLYLLVCTLLAIPSSIFASVSVSTPTAGTTVSSPVQYVATATTSTCSKGVASMGIYVNNVLTYVVSGASLNTQIALASGAEHTVVEEWDKCGGASYTTINLTVSGNPAPTVTIGANPTAVVTGASSILTVTATNATAVTLTGTDRTTVALSATGGTQAISPGTTTTYTATATGPGGTKTATTTVTVSSNPAPTVTVSANPTSITAGGTSGITVTSTYATAVTLSGNDGSTYTLPTATGGLVNVEPIVTTTYTAIATGAGGNASASSTVSVAANPAESVAVTANPSTVVAGNTAVLTVKTTNASEVSVQGSDGTSYTFSSASGGTQNVNPMTTTTYTATATGSKGTVTNSTTVTVTQANSIYKIDHVIFELQENHTFDNYFGMLNPYRIANHWNVGDDGVTYTVDGIEDKLKSISNKNDAGTVYPFFKFKSTCSDDNSSDWLASFGDVSPWNHALTRPINMSGFVHNAEGYAKSCASSGSCSGAFTDVAGQRAMGYYDQGFLNYYYYMASQFAVSDRWFSPVASKSIDNRIATFSGGTTQGLVKDPGGDDHLAQLSLPNIFKELDQAKVSWKIYYTVTQGYCMSDDDCGKGAGARWPASDFDTFSYSYLYLNKGSNGKCVAPNQPSSVVGDSENSFCIDPDHIAPLSAYYTDLANNTLPSFAFIEAGYANNDEHPGSGQSVLAGQYQMANIINALMASSSWNDSVFFFAYDEGGGPYDHVPPVPGHTNDFTSKSMGTLPDIASISNNPDSYFPCLPSSGTATTHCDLSNGEQGTNTSDASAIKGFGAQLGFRVPNFVVSPFTRRHYVSHTPIDHTAIIKFVENRFVGPAAHLTARDAVQPDLLEFFDFVNVPWATPPVPPAPVTKTSLGYNPCTPANM